MRINSIMLRLLVLLHYISNYLLQKLILFYIHIIVIINF